MNPLNHNPARELRQRNGRPDLSLSVVYLGPFEDGAAEVRREERHEQLVIVHLAAELTPVVAVADRLDLAGARRRQRTPETS